MRLVRMLRIILLTFRMQRISPNKFGLPLAFHTLADAQVRLRLGKAQTSLAYLSPFTLWLAPKLGCGSEVLK